MLQPKEFYGYSSIAVFLLGKILKSLWEKQLLGLWKTTGF